MLFHNALKKSTLFRNATITVTEYKMPLRKYTNVTNRGFCNNVARNGQAYIYVVNREETHLNMVLFLRDRCVQTNMQHIVSYLAFTPNNIAS